jgi:hypothetical protein
MNALAKTRYGIDPNSEDHIVSVNFIGIAIHTHQI